MKNRPKITLAEWELMESVWALSGKVTARDVHKKTFPKGEKAYTTVQTVLNKLHVKGYLSREKIGMVNFYNPTVSRKEMIKRQLSFFLSGIFDGSVPAFTNFLISTNQLSLKEIHAIKQVIEKKEQELRGKNE